MDNAVGAYEADKATVASQAANVKRLEQLVAFEKVYAPFDGVITARNTDVGQLINAGNGGAAQELFRISSTDKLRIFVSVPQMYSHAAVPGVNARIDADGIAGTPLHGKDRAKYRPPSIPPRAPCSRKWISTTPPASSCRERMPKFI